MNEFTGTSKESMIMRAVLSMPKGVEFTSRDVMASMMASKKTLRYAVTTGVIARYLHRYDGQYVRKCGKLGSFANTWELI